MVCLSRPASDDVRWRIKDVVDDAIASGDQRLLWSVYDQLGHERAKIRRLYPGCRDNAEPLGSDFVSFWPMVVLCVLALLAGVLFSVAIIEFFRL